MKILKIERENVANGIGVRTVIWVAGCDNQCPRLSFTLDVVI